MARQPRRRCALGFRVKSGYAVAIALAEPASRPSVLASTTVALSDPAVEATRQPYHAGLGSARQDARAIARLTRIIERCASASVNALLDTPGLHGHRCGGAGLVVGSVIDPDTVGNPHIRAHAHEGRLFRTVLERALRSRGIGCVIVVEKSLAAEAARTLGRPDREISAIVAALGVSIKGPWRAEAKAAATAAWMVLCGGGTKPGCGAGLT
jgi:hypothetical protein